MSFATIIAIGSLLLTLSASGAQLASLYTVTQNDGKLRRVNHLTASTQEIIAISLPGETVSGANGLAVHPGTGVLYALVRTESGFPFTRQLVTINHLTGEASLIGDTGDRFAGLAFDSAGTLYGVTGDGAAVPEALYTLSLTDATPTFVVALGNGGDGEAIAYNPDDGLLYHASGVNTGTTDSRIFEKIDLSSMTVTNIPISGSGYREITALTFFEGEFFASDTLSLLLRATDAGVFTAVGTTSHLPKGLAFVPPTPVPALGWHGRVLLAIVLILALLSMGTRLRPADLRR